MTLNVKERGDHVATFRWIEVRFMETLAGWVPTTPEMEAKLVFGTHVWEAAQHADVLGKRTQELRLPLHDSLRPSDAYVALLDEVAATGDTAKRVAGFYRCLLPGLERRFRDYLHRVDPLLDGPTVRVLERIIADGARMVSESRALLEEAPALRTVDERWVEDLRRRETALGEIVVPRAAEPAAASVA